MVSSFLTAGKDDKIFRLLLLGSAGVGKTGESTLELMRTGNYNCTTPDRNIIEIHFDGN